MIYGTTSHINLNGYSVVIAMKLQRQVAYKYKDKPRYKHVVVIPNQLVRKLGWNEGEELHGVVRSNMLLLKPTERER